MSLPNAENWNTRLLRTTRNTVLVAGMIGLTTLAHAQNTIPDAQVESNVLKALAGAPELANEAITTRTMYGTVTLSGSVRDEDARKRAENLAANADGVKKVVDELRLGSAGAEGNTAAIPTNANGGGAPMVLQSDGTYAAATDAQPAPGSAPAAGAQMNDPENDQAQFQQQAGQQQAGQQQGAGQQQQPDGSAPMDPNATAANTPAPMPNRRPLNGQYPAYPNYPAYPQQQGGAPPQQPGYPPQQPGYAANGQQQYGGQEPGVPVTIPAGALVRVRINRTLASNNVQPGTVFDGVVTNDVVSNGFIAIPRGASVQGKVLDAKSSGVLKGRGELSIQLTQVTLAGKTYPIVSDVWAHHGGDKTIETVNKTAGFGAAGALIGALAGGGVGAAVGGGIGAAAGLGSSAASGNGQVFIPAEGMLTFHLAEAAQVKTVSEQEMQRLAYAVPQGPDGRTYRRINRVYVGPAYYPGYYPGPYGPYGPYGYARY